jgi:hypothetical protein
MERDKQGSCRSRRVAFVNEMAIVCDKPATSRFGSISRTPTFENPSTRPSPG